MTIGLKNPNAGVARTPYAHIAWPDALDGYSGVAADWPDESRFAGEIRMHGDLTYGDEEYDKLIAESSAFRALHDWVYSDKFIAAFLEVFNDDIEAHVADGELLLDPRKLPIHAAPYETRSGIRPRHLSDTEQNEAFLFPRLDIGVGKKGYGKVNGGRGVHVDNVTRLVSLLLYVDENPTMIGGEHRMYNVVDGKPVVAVSYAPKPNLLVASLQSNRAYHDVNPITEIKGVRKALYMAISCSTRLWKPYANRRLEKLSQNRYRAGLIEKGVKKIAALTKTVANG